jgi:hypothetical protein
MKATRIIGAAICVAATGAPNWAAAQTVSSFTVVNADTGADIDTFTGNGTVIITATPRINVRANAANVKSVVLKEGSSSKVENVAPYALKGDTNGVYAKWSPAPGTYIISATPFAGSGGSGAAGPTATLALTIVTTPVAGGPPTVHAGVDQNLPSTGTTASLSGSASDAGGTIVSVLWTQVGGPNQASIATATANATQVSGLIAGVYTFRFTARDNDGNAASDDVNVQVASTQPQAGTGRLIIDPENPRAFVYDRDRDGDGRRDTAYMAASGGPEGFLYLSNTRKQQIINKLLSSAKVNSPVNGLYFHSTRAFGGDGGSAESPFIVNTDAKSGIDPNKLASWLVDLKRLDDAGVILWFNLFDDHSVPYGCKYNADYGNYASFIVNYFKALKHVVWVTQEEYDWNTGSQSACTKADNDGRQSGLAAAIRAADPTRPIATHHRGDQNMQFPNDPNIRVYGQQTFNRRSPESMHDSAGKQGQGNWVYVMAEAHPWHKDLIAAGNRTMLRRSNWATALSGGHVAMYDSFESNDPSDDMLDDLRHLRLFMESTAFNRLTALFDTALTNAKLDNTKYVLANQSQGLYILYGEFEVGKMGVRGAPAGTYALKWFDPASGQTVEQTGSVAADGIASFTKPASFGLEAALYLRKQ